MNLDERKKMIWWRFDKYEIKGGMIVPQPDANLEEYDLWGMYEETVAGRKRVAPPYDELLMLYRDATLSGKRAPVLTPKTSERLLGWCSRYGLTGILLQEVEEVVLAPQQPLGKEFASGKLKSIQPIYSRSGIDGWTDESDFEIDDEDSPYYIDKSPHVVLSRLSKSRTSREPIAKTWARFFPRTPADRLESYHYPVPCGEPFWREYAEPLEDFFRGIGFLFSALQHLTPLMASSYSELDVEASEIVNDGLGMLARLLDTVRPGLLPGDGTKFSGNWNAPSLLAGLAMMVREDLTAEGRCLQECDHCKRPFAANSSYKNLKYCSSRCRNSANAMKRRDKAE